MAIPKIIHYCWFGRGPKNELAEKCIASWKKVMPDYEIKEWNEDNFDISFNNYVKEAYDAKKFAFVSDVARLYIVYNNGGIYLDVDVETLKPFDNLLKHSAFFGFENENYINTGVGFGATKNNPVIKDMLDIYSGINFLLPNNCLDLTPCPVRNTNALLDWGLERNNQNQILKNNTVIYSSEYFNPKDFLTGNINLTENTHTIHHFSGSWHSEKDKKKAAKNKAKREKYVARYGEEKTEKIFARRNSVLRAVFYLRHPILAIKKFKEKLG